VLRPTASEIEAIALRSCRSGKEQRRQKMCGISEFFQVYFPRRLGAKKGSALDQGAKIPEIIVASWIIGLKFFISLLISPKFRYFTKRKKKK
jgi:hypothetical protein